MAQLLVFTRDNTNPQPEADRREFKTGDIIAVAEDSHQWGAAELGPPFRIVSFPGPRADYAHLTTHEPATMREVVPRSMIKVRRLQPYIAKVTRQAQWAKQRAYYVNASDQIIRKPLEGR